jgi:outer membrane lipoprotein SlyB
MRKSAIAGILLIAPLLGCNTQRPVLYPNYHLSTVGKQAAEEDIEDCMELASDDVGSGRDAGDLAEGAVVGGATGAATGAAGGAVVGRAGRWAGIGAAAGATRGAMRGLFRSREPDPVYRAYVNRCLRERGYDPIGWR